MSIKDILKLCGCILICEIAGICGSFFTAPKVQTWYQTISKPEFNPPDWVFAPAWTTLFILMGISLFIIIKDGFSPEKKLPIIAFFVQLVINISWSAVFFGLESIAGGLIVIILLIIFIILMIVSFYKVSKGAALLNIPYLLWVGFATLLNYSLYVLNTGG